MESIFKNYYYNFKMLFYSSSLYSDKSRNSILFFRKDFVIQKVIVFEFNFGRHGRTVRIASAFSFYKLVFVSFLDRFRHAFIDYD